MKKQEPDKEESGKLLPFMGRIFSAEGRAVTYLDTFSNFIILNVLTVFCSLPVFTAGAALSAACHCSFGILEGRAREGILKEYFGAWKRSWRRVTPIWLLMAAIFALLLLEFEITGSMSGRQRTVFRCFVTILLIVWFAVSAYLYPVLTRTQAKRKQALKNAAILALGNLPKTVLMVALSALPLLALQVYPGGIGIVLLLLVLLWAELCVMLNCFVYLRIEQKYSDYDPS